MSGVLRRYVRAEPALFVLVAAVYLGYFWKTGHDQFYWDSAHYWRLGESFGFYDPIRGYAYPLFNFLLHTVADVVRVSDVTIVRISGALLAAALGVVVAPRLARAIVPGAETGWVRVLALNGIVFVLWRDHFQFPLTDFPTLIVGSVGVIGLVRRTAGGYVVAGACFGLAANMRPAWVPLALAALVVAALLPAAPGGRRARARSAALVLVPLALVTLPQVAVNHLHHGGWSPTPAESRESSLTVLTQGLEIQKHETYVGPPDVYPQGVVHYYDPMTRDVLDDDDLPLRSYRHYVDVLLEHPFEMGTSYARHVFNGLDVRYATPYIRNLEHRPLILPIFAFTLLFVAATQLASSEARRRLGGVRWLGVAILVASILIAIPSPTTPRYFLGVHLLAYLIVCFSPALAAPLLRGGVVRTAGIALAYAGVLVVALTLSADTLRHTEFPLGEDAVSEAAALRVLPNR